MLDYIRQLLETDSLSPHGICLLWRPELIWTHIVSDALIAFAYFTIPGALIYFVARRRDVVFGWMFWCFAVFITACGATHILSIWTLYVPDYGLEAVVKAVTALASLGTAVVLWRLLPVALALPSPSELRVANQALRARVAERDQALADLEHETAERLQAEEMLRHAQKMEAVGQLTGGIAHDFNNILNIVLANLERIERYLRTDERLMKAVRDAMAGAERAAAMTHKLLAFARKQPLCPVPTDVNAAITDLSSLLHGTLGARIRLQTDLEPGLPRLVVDPSQFENAILNLVVNARDAMPEGGVLRLATRVAQGPAQAPAQGPTTEPGLPPVPHVVVEVQDSGTGMAPEVAAQAFEPFFTTKRLGEGTGLGLSQVFGFMQQSGGGAEIATEPGRGTTIRLSFALQAAPASAAAPRRVSVPHFAFAGGLTEGLAEGLAT